MIHYLRLILAQLTGGISNDGLLEVVAAALNVSLNKEPDEELDSWRSAILPDEVRADASRHASGHKRLVQGGGVQAAIRLLERTDPHVVTMSETYRSEEQRKLGAFFSSCPSTPCSEEVVNSAMQGLLDALFAPFHCIQIVFSTFWRTSSIFSCSRMFISLLDLSIPALRLCSCVSTVS